MLLTQETVPCRDMGAAICIEKNILVLFKQVDVLSIGYLAYAGL